MEEFIAIVPKQPYRPPAVSNEVRMEFEAVLLDAQNGETGRGGRGDDNDDQ